MTFSFHKNMYLFIYLTVWVFFFFSLAMQWPAHKLNVRKESRRKRELIRALACNNNLLANFFRLTQKAAPRHTKEAKDSQEANIKTNVVNKEALLKEPPPPLRIVMLIKAKTFTCLCRRVICRQGKDVHVLNEHFTKKRQFCHYLFPTMLMGRGAKLLTAGSHWSCVHNARAALLICCGSWSRESTQTRFLLQAATASALFLHWVWLF